MTLHFKVEKISLTGLTIGSIDTVMVDFTDLDADQTTAYTNFTPPGPGYLKSMSLSRDASSKDFETQKLKLMPGFRISWWYSGGEVTPDNKYKDEEMTKQFVR